MFDGAGKRVLLAVHTKFERRALHAMGGLNEFVAVIVDVATPPRQVERMRSRGRWLRAEQINRGKRMPSLLGIGSGLTVTRAVAFDESGVVLAVARRRVAQAHHVDRDVAARWRATADAIAEVSEASGRPASDIKGVAATAHGDGLYLLDRASAPLGLGILSLDSRARQVVADWQADGTSALALQISGQTPQAASPAALLA